MARCGICTRGGWLQRVDDLGLCRACTNTIGPSIRRAMSSLESMHDTLLCEGSLDVSARTRIKNFTALLEGISEIRPMIERGLRISVAEIDFYSDAITEHLREAYKEVADDLADNATDKAAERESRASADRVLDAAMVKLQEIAVKAGCEECIREAVESIDRERVTIHRDIDEWAAEMKDNT